MANENAGLAALTAYSGISGAFAASKMGEARRIMSESNQEIAELRAGLVKKKGEVAVGRSRKRFKKILGKQRAALAAQGIRLDEGSAAEIQEETGVVSELDALTIKINAGREAFGISQEGAVSGFEGKLQESAGQFRAAESLITGGVRAAELYQRGKEKV